MLYLQELHTHGLANAEHTTLLLNTYAKVGDVAKVDAFVRSEGRTVGTVAFDGKTVPGDGTSREPPFDLDTAIRVCRQAGFFEQAAYLAKRWGRHEDYLRVVVEDIGAASGDVKATERTGKDKTENGYRAAVSYLREVGGVGVSFPPAYSRDHWLTLGLIGGIKPSSLLPCPFGQPPERDNTITD